MVPYVDLSYVFFFYFNFCLPNLFNLSNTFQTDVLYLSLLTLAKIYWCKFKLSCCMDIP